METSELKNALANLRRDLNGARQKREDLEPLFSRLKILQTTYNSIDGFEDPDFNNANHLIQIKLNLKTGGSQSKNLIDRQISRMLKYISEQEMDSAK